MNRETFRTIALSMPEAIEGEHMNHPDFRIGGKIFASLHPKDTNLGMVKLSPDQQREFTESHPEAFEPVNGAWGKRGATYVRFDEVDKVTLRSAMIAAWRNTAPKKMVADLDIQRPR